MKKTASKQTILGQPSWTIRTPRVEAFVTETGGHLGPVTFDRGERKIQPFSVAPWAEEKLDDSVPTILRVLRGDFFCLPFGGNETPYRGERHPVHGETANRKWTFESLGDVDGKTRLHLSMKTKVRRGRVDKFISVARDHDAIYESHVMSGMSGVINFGHHATLKFPDEPGSGIISTSLFVHGQVFPGVVESPANRGYSSLKPGAAFKSLERVPSLVSIAKTGGLQSAGFADLTRYPARRGFEDIVMVVADEKLPFAWTAVTFPKQRYVWFALKDPKVLRETVFWISNGGRHYPPWNGRHVNVMGLEEVTSYFHPGLAESVARNPLSERGIPTSVRLSPAKPLTVNYIMAVAAIPSGFDRVNDVVADGRGGVSIVSASGKRVGVPIDLEFIQSRGRADID